MLHPTERDLILCQDLGELGIADTLMLCRRHFGDPSDKNILRYCQHRLAQLAAAGFLESHKLAVNYAEGIRKLPTIWRLATKGADLVEELTDIRPRRPGNSEAPSPITLRHRLGVVYDRVTIDHAHRVVGLAPPPCIMEQDLYDDGREIKLTDPPEKKFILKESWGTGPTRVTCRPDFSLLLHMPDETGQLRWLVAAYLEHDRSSEGSTVADKAAGYATLLDPKTNHYRRHWPQAHTARVLFICLSQQRLENVADLIHDLPGAEHWRFAVQADLTPTPDAQSPHDRAPSLLQPVWRDADLNPRPLFLTLPATKDPTTP